MFEISDLKAKKLPELQEIAKGLDVPKYRTQKKLDLVYQILDLQASNPKITSEVASADNAEKEDQPKSKPKPRALRAPRAKVTKEETDKSSSNPSSKDSKDAKDSKNSDTGTMETKKPRPRPQNAKSPSSKKEQKDSANHKIQSNTL